MDGVIHSGKKPWAEMESFLAILERNRDDMEKNRGTMERTMGVQERIRGVPRKNIHTRIFPGRRDPANPYRTRLCGGRAFLILEDAVTSRKTPEYLSLSGLAPGRERVGSVWEKPGWQGLPQGEGNGGCRHGTAAREECGKGSDPAGRRGHGGKKKHGWF